MATGRKVCRNKDRDFEKFTDNRTMEPNIFQQVHPRKGEATSSLALALISLFLHVKFCRPIKARLLLCQILPHRDSWALDLLLLGFAVSFVVSCVFNGGPGIVEADTIEHGRGISNGLPVK